MSHCMHCVFLQFYCMQSSIGLALDVLCLAMNLKQNSQYFVEYILLYKKHLSFAGARSQMNTTLNQNRPGEICIWNSSTTGFIA